MFKVEKIAISDQKLTTYCYFSNKKLLARKFCIHFVPKHIII